MEEYEKYKAEHPGWSDEQIWTAISLSMQADNIIEKKGEDIDENDSEIMEGIIRGAMQWLDDALPFIFEKVKQFFASLLSNLGKWIKKGWDYIFEYLSSYQFDY